MQNYFSMTFLIVFQQSNIVPKLLLMSVHGSRTFALLEKVHVVLARRYLHGYTFSDCIYYFLHHL
jgi:hypothetical protein